MSIENNSENHLSFDGEDKRKDYLSDVLILVRQRRLYKQSFCIYPDNKYHWIMTRNNYFCLFENLQKYEMLPFLSAPPPPLFDQTLRLNPFSLFPLMIIWIIWLCLTIVKLLV